MQCELTHARMDPAHCLAPGLFRSLKKGDRKKHKLQVVYEFRDGNSRIEFCGPEPLGDDDLRVMQGLVALAAVSGESGRGIVLSAEPGSEDGQQLRALLETQFEAVDKCAMVVAGSYARLAMEIGYADPYSGSAMKAIKRCIERLWKVSVVVQNGTKRMGFRILSQYACDSADGQLFVALNPRLAEAIMGDSQHMRIEMEEVRGLNTGPARLMHQRLHWINAGKTKPVKLETLCSYIWPEDATPSTMRQRHRTARNALKELKGLGWGVDEYAPGKFNITRPNPQRRTS